LADPSKAGEIDRFTGAPPALLHTQDTIGADGVLYKAGTPVIVFRNATGTFGTEVYNPLSMGTYRNNRITGQGQFTLDMAMSKSVEFMEGKRIEVRIDTANILNHPLMTGTAPGSVRVNYGGRLISAAGPANLSLNAAGATALGDMPTKVGHRTFQARIRLSF